MAAGVSTLNREPYIYTEEKLKTVKGLAQGKFEANPDERIIKLSRKTHPELTQSIYAVKDRFGRASYHAHVHKETDTNKGHTGDGSWKTGYLIPNLEDPTGLSDKVRILWRGNPLHDDDLVAIRHRQVLRDLNQLLNGERELLSIDDLVRVDSKRSKGELFLIAPNAGPHLLEYLEENKNALTFEKKKDLALKIMRAVDAIYSVGRVHGDLDFPNIRVKTDSSHAIKVSLIDFDNSKQIKCISKEEDHDSIDLPRTLRAIFNKDEFIEFIGSDLSEFKFFKLDVKNIDVEKLYNLGENDGSEYLNL